MAGQYAEPDREVVDYHTFCLDPHVFDPATASPLVIRGPRPSRLDRGGYFVCIGAAQTFGRFCPKPYPTLLKERLGLPVLNLGRGGAGPAFFLKSTPALFGYVNRACFAVVQVMSGRSAGNTLFRSDGLGFYHRVVDGAPLSADDAFRALLNDGDRSVLERVVQETRKDWTDSCLQLLRRIEVPTLLFWFSVRAPDYPEGHGSVSELFGEFPQLVNAEMIETVRAHGSLYVECITRRGLPQPLVNRFTGQPVTVSDPWGGAWSKNAYYPSPEMHVDAADVLESPCRALATSARRSGGSARPVPAVAKRRGRTSMVDPPVIAQPPLRQSVRTRLGRAAFRLRNLALDWGLRSGHRDYARFIILGEGRSGSNFLRGLLNSHPQILAFGELFRFTDAIGWEFPDHDLYLSTARLIALSRDDPGAFLEREVFRRHPGAIRAVGFKIFYYHADQSSRSAVWSYLESHREIKVIHIKRRNTLRALLSLKKAFATNRWTEAGPPAPDTLSVLLDPDECRRRFALAEDTKARFDAVFGQNARLDVVYEELERDHDGQMSRVQDFLGVDHRKVKPLTYKQASMPLARAIVNYGELKAIFADTRWKELFDE